MYKYLFFFFVVGILACKGGNNSESNNGEAGSADEVVQEPEYDFDAMEYETPDPLELISVSDVENALGLNPGDVYATIPNGTPTARVKSVFYKVKEEGQPNAAMLFHISSNPLPDELQDYASTAIQNKVMHGERSLNDPDQMVEFDAWDVGMSGASNKEESTYYWRDGRDVIFMIAFNLSLISTDKEFEAATKLANLVSPGS